MRETAVVVESPVSTDVSDSLCAEISRILPIGNSSPATLTSGPSAVYLMPST